MSIEQPKITQEQWKKAHTDSEAREALVQSGTCLVPRPSRNLSLRRHLPHINEEGYEAMPAQELRALLNALGCHGPHDDPDGPGAA